MNILFRTLIEWNLRVGMHKHIHFSIFTLYSQTDTYFCNTVRTARSHLIVCSWLTKIYRNERKFSREYTPITGTVGRITSTKQSFHRCYSMALSLISFMWKLANNSNRKLIENHININIHWGCPFYRQPTMVIIISTHKKKKTLTIHKH